MQGVLRESDRIADAIDRMLHGGAWHGPAIQEALEGVSAAHAAARPIRAAHTIWEIVLHMTSWATEVAGRLTRDLRPLDGEADWPPVGPVDDAAWEATRSRLAEAHRRLRLAIREFPPARLDETVGGNGHNEGSFYVMLHGLAQHDAYHTGQISLLKRAMEEGGGA
ncbi:MAG TPA: DinB family protein [Gemmatimonadales bacterium]|jgi:uncharacterized damage-inducible protein DinB